MVLMATLSTTEYNIPTGHLSQNYAAILGECARSKSLKEGKRVHKLLVSEGLESNLVLANHLVDMYGKCGCIVEAQFLFDRMPHHNVYSWMALLSAYNSLGLANEVLTQYNEICQFIAPDKYIFVTVLSACTSLQTLEWGRDVHDYMTKLGTDVDSFVQSALINMYIKCGCTLDAYNIFSGSDGQNVVLWNDMILGCVQQGYNEEAINLLREMSQKGIVPDQLTYLGGIQAYANKGLLENVQRCHIELVVFDYISDINVSNTVIVAYTKCSSFEDASVVFKRMLKKDVVSYNVMIACHIQQGLNDRAVSLYRQLKQDGLWPNETTIVYVIKAFTVLQDGANGKRFHEEVLKDGCKINPFVASSLIDMYCKCGMIADGYEVFVTTEDRNLVVWTAMIAGYAQQGFGKEALDLFLKMERKGMKPNEATMVSVLKACSILGEQATGERIHKQIKESSLYSNVLVLNSLIEMHASFGNMDEALLAFTEMPERDVVSWTALIGGYAQQGLVEEAFSLFHQMLKKRVKPNAITFITVLSACSHAGLIEKGCFYFYAMVTEHGIMPGSDQYAIIIDLLGRAGHLEEAARVIINMEGQQTELAWRTLLGACRILSHKSLAKFAMKQLTWLNPQNDAAYVLLANTNDMGNRFWSLDAENLGMVALPEHSFETAYRNNIAFEADLLAQEV